jgi:diacylglycerol kinase family enzyme
MSHVCFKIDGGEPFETGILLAGVGNGRFSGGGFDGVPLAVVGDDYLDLMYIEPITRGQFIKKIGTYHDGKHPEDPFLKNITRMYRVKDVDIEPVGGLVFTTDGEPHYTEKTLKVSIAPEKVKFILPDGISLR